MGKKEWKVGKERRKRAKDGLMDEIAGRNRMGLYDGWENKDSLCITQGKWVGLSYTPSAGIS